MAEPGRPAESESPPRATATIRSSSWTPFSGVALVFVAVCTVSARIGASGLPTECGEVSRPNLDAVVFLALSVAVLSWVLAAYGLLRMRSAWWLRLAFSCIAAAEALAWLAVLFYYHHQIKIYNGGTCF